MDLFDNNKETEKGKNSTHEQLSLDFGLAPEAAPNEEKDISSAAPEKKQEKQKVEKEEKKKSKKKYFEGGFRDGGLAAEGSFGKYLQNMRVKNDCSIAQVEQITRIRSRYIELLEMENLRSELPSVYVLAYTRKLCACYKVPADKTKSIINELKNELDSSIPAELAENINFDYEIGEENQKKLRHFAWLLLGAVIFFAALLGVAVFMLSGPSKPTTASQLNPIAAAEKFDQEKLRVLQAPIIIEATELPAKTD